MGKFLFIVVSTASLAIVDSALAQYTPPALGGASPGYMWREQRANDDWRNQTWREQRLNEDWRNNNWRTQRANEDWRQREDYSKKATPNNAIDKGYVGGATVTDKTNNKTADKDKECGFGSVGSPRPCLDYAKDKTKIDHAIDRTKNGPITGNPTDSGPNGR